MPCQRGSESARGGRRNSMGMGGMENVCWDDWGSRERGGGGEGGRGGGGGEGQRRKRVTCVECHGFESHPKQLIFLRKSDCLGCAVLL